LQILKISKIMNSNNSIEYYYTTYGDIYAGYGFTEIDFEDYIFIIQSSKLSDYNKLPFQEKTLDKISEYGWALKKETIAEKIVRYPIKSEQKHPNSILNVDNRKHLFVFGAGASAHCVFGNEKEQFYSDSLRPPVGTALFELRFKSIYEKYKAVKKSLYFLQNDPSPDVEELFENEWKNILLNNNSIQFRHINIQYYLQEVLMKVSNNIIDNYYSKNLYAIFSDKLQKLYSESIKDESSHITFKRFGFVSFNQDTILEHFISEYFGIPIRTVDDYVQVNDSPFCIFKPHGSWNWGWKFPNNSVINNNISDWLYDNKKTYYDLYYNLLGNNVDMVDWNRWRTDARLHKNNLSKHTIDKSQLQIIDFEKVNEFFPALLLPYRDKDDFTMPHQHLLDMNAYISSVEVLVIIGWKGNEEMFNRLLFKDGNRIKKLIIVDPNSDVVKQNLEPLLSRIKDENIKVYKTFEEFVFNGFDNEIV